MEDPVAQAQLQKDMEMIRIRDEKRRREEEERKRRADEERREEERKAKEEKLRRLEEERQRIKREEEWKKLGSDKIQPLPPVPPSVLDDNDPNVLKSWYLDDETSKPVLRQASLKPGKRLDAPRVMLSMLRELGIVYFRVNLNDFSIVNQIVKERCYKHVDEIKLTQTCKDEMFLEKWFMEHFNEDEEFRLVTDGSCYYDIRSKNDTWIRLHCTAGDLIILPAGMYHRSTLDEGDFAAIMRVFRDAQRWNPIFRSEKRAENHPARLAYLRSLKKGNVAVDLGFK